MGATKGGELVYMIYKAVTHGLTPLINLHIRWRKFRGLEHPLRWPERLGRPSISRPPGPLIWFHAVSLGEGMCVVPVIKRCVERRSDVTVLMTTTTTSAFEVLKTLLPCGVIYQFAPVDTPAAVNAFLGYWKPYALVLVESELWPNLVLGASANGVMLALLNARMSTKSFNNWSRPVVRLLTSLMLSKFSLIVPLSNIQAIQLQLLQAPPFVINFSGDLKLGIGELVNKTKNMRNMEDLQGKVAGRCVWMASSIHRGEEEVMLHVHRGLMQKHPNILAIIVPRHPHLGQKIALDLQKEGVNVALRSHGDSLTSETSIYVVDTLGELREFYGLTPIAVIGGSFLPGFTGHNFSEAAAAGCAVLTGQHVGHFSHMAMAMQQLNPLSVTQVGGGMELEEILDKLVSNPEILEARRVAAKQAFHALSSGVVENAWTLLQLHIFRKARAEGG
ncbi:probable 3-deoxy-D-manno-octulosonic acid transferase, mitochondrial isoform X1 [Cynara cardunculus var. scolymus]|uniref:probable 3-deoxy-D-manno-octulosonic acid transferase, mitochondrial isoform X1 n=1 Tax=Cynara cardunculus var. scolymus TaxID=59895 RepID=UPI000D62D168|nr:probable 3-deoxy-D-manno-octulosonic acid transferase, mitochondrial isoform X1 [Cynara cardunculus var. scolymus]XP_024984336.1 probable 3-deoxy-D-manno-octulosonic acid transferase, mitochondrial isoform X1 [Cynara cardunculus var. scolymus]XP_024984337.1 probable 3-deoxy-D-manno-octulosonic acid transferase, mitochondrial isoform X1 [Cynara cardunculus var. scolymus]XP_024984338.1 probable 3-deoxy-D-manno-octulosonic acid transferase, mitochondrial isoform X1 [Cynara cardunculus var. scoly